MSQSTVMVMSNCFPHKSEVKLGVYVLYKCGLCNAEGFKF